MRLAIVAAIWSIYRKNFGFSGTGKTDWNFTWDYPAFDFDRWSDLPGSQPFFAQLNFVETHRPFKAPPHADPARVRLPAYYPDHPIIRRDYAQYLDSATELDRKIGLVLARLRRDGLDRSTIIIFLADNGEAHLRGKQFCYEEGLHCPLIIRWAPGFPPPRNFTPGTVDGRLLESIDITATTLALAGLPRPPAMDGRIFLGDHAEPARACVVGARDRCDETVMRIRTVRDSRYRYIRNFTPQYSILSPNKYKEGFYPTFNLLRELDAAGRLTPAQQTLCRSRLPDEELYDLAADPDEIHNLPDDPAHAPVLARLRWQLQDWITRTGDQGARHESPAEIERETRR